ncbi:MAG: glucosaminidase domain-containing protein [Candidatus Nomurabacteria bacterium]|nr:glucosaminidase domain-containing protein [Candidatus Nomurabacteria bacterium]
MNKNNLIRFAQSLMFLPFVAGTTVPLGSIILDTTKDTTQAVFTQKQNIEASGILAFNQVLAQIAERDKDQKTKADAIDAYFSEHDMPLLGTGMKMVQEAEKNNLDWRLLPAIAVRESTGGKNDCIKATNNPFGWGSCKIGFDSLNEAIETVAMNLGGNNPKTEKHYADKTTKQILRAYNPPSIVARYAEQVIKIMNDIGSEDLVVEAKV